MALTASIISKFDNSGIRKAEKGFGRLSKHAGKMKLALAGASAAFIALGKAGVQAAAEDMAAQKRLDSLLENSGFANAVKPVEDYIASLEWATGVADDELRPAFQKMFGVLNDATASMGLMNAAMDISAGTGKSLDEVTTTLTKAILGQRKGLVGLGLGIDATTAKTIDMADVMAIASDKFGGMSEEIAGTPLGQLNKLKTAFGNLQEQVGYGFLEGLGNSDQAVKDFITDVTILAGGLGKLFGAVARGFSSMVRGIDDVLNFLGILDEKVIATGQNMVDFAEVGAINMQRFAITAEQIDQRFAEIALDKKMEEIRKRQLAAQAKQNAADKKSLAIKVAMAKWDSQLINIEVAKKRSKNQGTIDRLLQLQSDTLLSQGLTATQAGMTTGNKVAPTVIVNVQGSVVAERDLLDTIQRQVLNSYLANSSSRSGGWL